MILSCLIFFQKCICHSATYLNKSYVCLRAILHQMMSAQQLPLHQINFIISQWPVQCAQSLNLHHKAVCVYLDSASLFSVFYAVSWSCKGEAVKASRSTGTDETQPR